LRFGIPVLGRFLFDCRLDSARGVLSEILSTIRLGCALLNLCVWVRSNGGIGSLYRSRHELVFVFGRRDATRADDVQPGKHGRNRRTGRRGYAIELDPSHVDTAIARWERIAKQTAVSCEREDI
jgi:hypothetical protein